MALTEAQSEFVGRFILSLPHSTVDTQVDELASARAQWFQASEAVDNQIASLQSVLKQTDNEDLHEIAEFGLNAMTADHKVKLMAALQDARSAAPAAILALHKAAAEFRGHLESSGSIGACDDNPFGVTVAIRATLLPALKALEAVSA